MAPVAEYLGALQMERGASRNTLARVSPRPRGLRPRSSRGRRRRIETADLDDLIVTTTSARSGAAASAAASVARRLSAVRGLYRFLVASGVIRRDPTEHLDSPAPAASLAADACRSEDVAALVESPDTTRPDGLRDRALLELLYATGMRASEAIALRLDDVNLQRRLRRLHGQGQPAAPGPRGRAGARVDARATSTARRPRLVKRGDPRPRSS